MKNEQKFGMGVIFVSEAFGLAGSVEYLLHSSFLVIINRIDSSRIILPNLFLEGFRLLLGPLLWIAFSAAALCRMTIGCSLAVNLPLITSRHVSRPMGN